MYPTPLTLENLTLPKEKTYFNIALVLSVLVWIPVVITVVGLFYGVLLAIFVWFVNGLLVARLKSEAVQVTEKQLPDLFKAYQDVCQELRVTPAPELYLLQSGGLLNAFATRHSGRHFVVIYSSILEAYGLHSPEIKFLIGHELGHIKSNHVFKRVLLFPGLLVPLLGSAYFRACEATCDRFGAFSAGSIDGAIKAMLTLGGGKDAAHVMDPEAYAEQYYANRGFFVSWHELASTYPTMSQRVSNLLAIKNNHFRRPPSRHFLGYLFAFFFNFRTLVVIYMLAIMSAIAVPAVTNALKKGQEIQKKQQKAMEEAEEKNGGDTSGQSRDTTEDREPPKVEMPPSSQ